MRQDDGLPPIITVAGLKKSGKTTVASALIRELRARGFRVGSVKTIRHHPLTLDASGADTRRHAEAGAEFTVVLLDEELAYFETREARPGLEDAARLVRAGDRLRGVGGHVRSRGRARARGLPPPGLGLRDDPRGETGAAFVDHRDLGGCHGGRLGAGTGAGTALDSVPADIPVVDATSPGGAAALADLVVRWFGEGRR